MRTSTGRYRGLQSFFDAARGIRSVFRTEWNFRIHVGLFLCVVGACVFFGASALEWIAIALSAGLVFVAELLNTAIEYLADAVHPESDQGIGMAKDAAAGGVLIAAVAATVVGAIVFLPKVWMWLTSL
ncbi:MAG: diacylglycerol kinase family protein [Verrucomicrobiales bacterium]|jgi:undecaprenol kinase|nr:diacylglycerol kinase family protein [Verrucomicrobiales bacterium]MBP9225886.1 diacylglycerol kinase family protein [Verrucomicrobiales bacterium]